LTHLHN